MIAAFDFSSAARFFFARHAERAVFSRLHLMRLIAPLRRRYLGLSPRYVARLMMLDARRSFSAFTPCASMRRRRCRQCCVRASKCGYYAQILRARAVREARCAQCTPPPRVRRAAQCAVHVAARELLRATPVPTPSRCREVCRAVYRRATMRCAARRSMRGAPQLLQMP